MDWHRLFGLILTDFFAGSPFRVELEKDLALKQQRLDVVILRRGQGPFAGQLPDGLDDLAAHNLITFKSHHDALDDWALKELTGHYVNYRKQCTPRGKPLLPEADFRLYAVCSRYPQNLAAGVQLSPIQQGVYACERGTDRIRIIVAGQVAEEPRNALLHLFSASAEKVGYGADHYRQNSPDTSSLLHKLLGSYQGEGIAMSYTMADFRRDFAVEQLTKMTPDERKQALQRLPLDELLAGKSAKEIAAYLKKLRSERLPRKGKPRRGN
jgi:hypothetical protein